MTNKIISIKDNLIILVCSNEDVLRYKGTQPVMTAEERCEIIRHCRYVDEIFKSPPFYPTLEFINDIKVRKFNIILH